MNKLLAFKGDQSREQRFWNKVVKAADDGCWEWQGFRNAEGYGQFQWASYTGRRAHRAAWELTHGPIPSGLCVLHRCDNPSCVRPDHLFLGTHGDNARDRDSKGRGVLRPGVRWSTKLSVDDVRALRRAHARGDASQKDLAARYGITRAQVSNIVTGKNWKGVT